MTTLAPSDHTTSGRSPIARLLAPAAHLDAQIVAEGIYPDCPLAVHGMQPAIAQSSATTVHGWPARVACHRIRNAGSADYCPWQVCDTILTHNMPKLAKYYRHSSIDKIGYQ
jgi:hypothetical protein